MHNTNINEDIITSANTSRNVLNPVYKLLADKYPVGTLVLDYGCGKYDKNRIYANQHGLKWLGYDPYCRSQKENIKTLQFIDEHKPDVIVCSNVLNVLDDATIPQVLDSIRSLADDNTDIYFAIFEKNKNGIHEITRDGYQRNEKTKDYIKWLWKFDQDSISIKGNIIKCNIIKCNTNKNNKIENGEIIQKGA